MDESFRAWRSWRTRRYENISVLPVCQSMPNAMHAPSFFFGVPVFQFSMSDRLITVVSDHLATMTLGTESHWPTIAHPLPSPASSIVFHLDKSCCRSAPVHKGSAGMTSFIVHKGHPVFQTQLMRLKPSLWLKNQQVRSLNFCNWWFQHHVSIFTTFTLQCAHSVWIHRRLTLHAFQCKDLTSKLAADGDEAVLPSKCRLLAVDIWCTSMSTLQTYNAQRYFEWLR